MVKNPKAKGSAFERKVAKDISLWLTDGEDSTQLIRSVLSGGWVDRSQRHAADLAANGEHGEEFRVRFGVECKNSEEFDYKHVWTSENPKMFEWWKKHSEECREVDIIPLIVWKKKFVPTIIGFPGELGVEGGDEKMMIFKINGEFVTFITLEDFFDRNTPENLYRKVDTWKKDRTQKK